MKRCVLQEVVGRCVLVAAGVVALAVIGACRVEEKVVQYKPFFSGLGGSGWTRNDGSSAVPINSAPGYTDPTRAGGAEGTGGDDSNKLIVKLPNGKKRVKTGNVHALMTVLESALDAGEDDLLLEQVVSSKTKDEYLSRGEDPHEILRFLRFYRRDLAKLFARMPMAEHTPTVILDQPGDRVWVLRLTGTATKDMEFTRLWARMEEGNWRFVWVE